MCVSASLEHGHGLLSTWHSVHGLPGSHCKAADSGEEAACRQGCCGCLVRCAALSISCCCSMRASTSHPRHGPSGESPFLLAGRELLVGLGTPGLPPGTAGTCDDKAVRLKSRRRCCTSASSPLPCASSKVSVNREMGGGGECKKQFRAKQRDAPF